MNVVPATAIVLVTTQHIKQSLTTITRTNNSTLRALLDVPLQIKASEMDIVKQTMATAGTMCQEQM